MTDTFVNPITLMNEVLHHVAKMAYPTQPGVPIYAGRVVIQADDLQAATEIYEKLPQFFRILPLVKVDDVTGGKPQIAQVLWRTSDMATWTDKPGLAYLLPYALLSRNLIGVVADLRDMSGYRWGNADKGTTSEMVLNGK